MPRASTFTSLVGSAIAEIESKEKLYASLVSLLSLVTVIEYCLLGIRFSPINKKVFVFLLVESKEFGTNVPLYTFDGLSESNNLIL